MAILFSIGLLVHGGLAVAASDERIRSAGVLTFSPDGVLFVADNVGGAIYAYPTQGQTGKAQPPSAAPFAIDKIDARIGKVLGARDGRLTVNGMAVQPASREVYLSVTRGSGTSALPAVVKVSADGAISNVPLTSPSGRFAIANQPRLDQKFRDRAGDWPVPAADSYHQKATTSMRSMTVVDMKFHDGELFVSGISNEEFASTLRRVKYPFSGEVSNTQVRIYHVAHERYETRAPIRAMTFANVDGQDTLIAGYTCSPLVLIPVVELKDGAKVTGKTIGDMGNGQPLSMFTVNAFGQDMVFATNMAHGPRMIPVVGLQKAKGYVPDNSPHNYPSDLSPEFPLGPVGKSVMFVGASLQAAQLNDKYIVSVTRDGPSGEMLLEALPIAPLPMKLDEIWSEFDFQGGGPAVSSK